MKKKNNKKIKENLMKSKRPAGNSMVKYYMINIYLI